MKGILIGFAIFAIASLVSLIKRMGPLAPNKATGLSVITGATIHNTNWWIAFALTLAASYFYFKTPS